MIREVFLHGRLADEYTPKIELDADDIRMIVAGINSNHPGFMEDFTEGEWHILRGDAMNKDSMTTEEAQMTLGNVKQIHIFPKLEGAGGDNGLMSVVLGIAIVAVAWWAAPAVGGLGASALSFGGASLTYGNIAMFGVAMALGGVAQMMAPTPKLGDMMAAERAQDRPSFMFNGPVNVMVPGGPVPLVYGEFETGSTVVSAGVMVEKIAI